MSNSTWGYATGDQEPPEKDITLELLVDETHNEFTIYDPQRVERGSDKHCWITAETEGSIVLIEDMV